MAGLHTGENFSDDERLDTKISKLRTTKIDRDIAIAVAAIHFRNNLDAHLWMAIEERYKRGTNHFEPNDGGTDTQQDIVIVESASVAC